MSNESRFFRLRAAVRNSVVWGVAWGAIGTVAATAMRLIDKIPLGHAVLDGIGMGSRELRSLRSSVSRTAESGFRKSAGCDSVSEVRYSPGCSCPRFCKR